MVKNTAKILPVAVKSEFKNAYAQVRSLAKSSAVTNYRIHSRELAKRLLSEVEAALHLAEEFDALCEATGIRSPYKDKGDRNSLDVARLATAVIKLGFSEIDEKGNLVLERFTHKGSGKEKVRPKVTESEPQVAKYKSIVVRLHELKSSGKDWQAELEKPFAEQLTMARPKIDPDYDAELDNAEDALESATAWMKKKYQQTQLDIKTQHKVPHAVDQGYYPALVNIDIDGGITLVAVATPNSANDADEETKQRIAVTKAAKTVTNLIAPPAVTGSRQLSNKALNALNTLARNVTGEKISRFRNSKKNQFEIIVTTSETKSVVAQWKGDYTKDFPSTGNSWKWIPPAAMKELAKIEKLGLNTSDDVEVVADKKGIVIRRRDGKRVDVEVGFSAGDNREVPWDYKKRPKRVFNGKIAFKSKASLTITQPVLEALDAACVTKSKLPIKNKKSREAAQQIKITLKKNGVEFDAEQVADVGEAKPKGGASITVLKRVKNLTHHFLGGVMRFDPKVGVQFELDGTIVTLPLAIGGEMRPFSKSHMTMVFK